MEKENKSTSQLGDIVEFDEHTLELSEIEAIVASNQVRRQYEQKYQGRLYRILLLSLTHESFPEDEAKRLWQAIVAHMRHLNTALGRSVGLPVASLDYLTNIKGALNEPKIIEEDKSSFVALAATKDELTGLYLRDVFDVVLKKELDQIKRRSSVVSLLMIDIDDFKHINDTYGHQKGDEILAGIGTAINDSIRQMDMAARYGGEELVVIMPGADIEKGRLAAERIRQRIENMAFGDVTVTVSVGVSQTGPQTDSPKALIRTADKALYRAKEAGKNCTFTGDMSGCP
jgi:diguanylate cyclase (GGDEF)-like protein